MADEMRFRMVQGKFAPGTGTKPIWPPSILIDPEFIDPAVFGIERSQSMTDVNEHPRLPLVWEKCRFCGMPVYQPPIGVAGVVAPWLHQNDRTVCQTGHPYRAAPLR